MASKFYKNTILMGCVDFYCLACESYLRSDEDANIHIEKPVHKKNLESALYVEKYKNDYVRKVKKGYFCEFCNLLLPTAAKVGLHVEESNHKYNKGVILLKRIGNAVTAFENVSITEKAWNGLIDNTCVICNTEFENEQLHKTEQMHILSLVQSKHEFGIGDTIYRKVFRERRNNGDKRNKKKKNWVGVKKHEDIMYDQPNEIDDSSFQCLTCNVVLSTSTITTHFENAQHKDLYAKCCENITALKTEQRSVENQERNSIEKEQKSLPNAKKQIKENTKKATEKNLKTDKITDLDEFYSDVLNAKDYIITDDNGMKLCILCDWSMENMAVATHLGGQHHQTILKFHKKRIEKQKVATKKEMVTNTVGGDDKDKILDSVSRFQNNDININFLSGTAFCKKCSKDLDFVFDSIENHIEGHKKKVAKKESPKLPFPSGADENLSNTERNTLFTKPVFMKKDEEKIVATRSNSVASSIDEEVEMFAKQNNMSINRMDNKARCNICDSQVPTSIRSMKEHMGGLAHKNKLAKQTEPKAIKKQVLKKEPTSKFVKHLTTVEKLFIKDVVINEKFVLNIYSFFFITKRNFSLKCEACEVGVSVDQIDAHKGTHRHEEVMQEARVVTSIDSEFIREVRSGVYHCGYCNIVEDDWDDMLEHLSTTEHRESKTSAEWRLREYMPEIRQNNRRKEMEMMFLMQMLAGGNMF